MRPQDPNPHAVVAPGEIRELLARLTQQSVEAVPAHEARTLEALALETGIPLARLRETLGEMRRAGRLAVPPAAWFGFAFLALFAYWVVGHPPPGAVPVSVPATPEVVAPKVPEPDLSGTVPLTSVTYGPDAGPIQVDPSFAPTKALPEGISVTASVGPVLWGSGDHRAKAIDKPLTPEEEAIVRNGAVELLNYVRSDASRRHLAADATGAFQVSLQAYLYSGSGYASVKLAPPAGGKDAAAESAIRRSADTFVESIQQSLRQQRKWHREQGP